MAGRLEREKDREGGGDKGRKGRKYFIYRSTQHILFYGYMASNEG